MKANLITKTIEMSKNEAKAAGRIGTEKFNELREYQRAYPNYTICIVEAPKRKAQYSGLDYDYMEKYIKECDKSDKEKEEIMKEFRTLRGLDMENHADCVRAVAASYPQIKKWFLGKFSEIGEFRKNQNKKIAEILNVA